MNCRASSPTSLEARSGQSPSHSSFMYEQAHDHNLVLPWLPQQTYRPAKGDSPSCTQEPSLLKSALYPGQSGLQHSAWRAEFSSELSVSSTLASGPSSFCLISYRLRLSCHGSFLPSPLLGPHIPLWLSPMPLFQGYKEQSTESFPPPIDTALGLCPPCSGPLTWALPGGPGGWR